MKTIDEIVKEPTPKQIVHAVKHMNARQRREFYLHFHELMDNLYPVKDEAEEKQKVISKLLSPYQQKLINQLWNSSKEYEHELGYVDEVEWAAVINSRIKSIIDRDGHPILDSL